MAARSQRLPSWLSPRSPSAGLYLIGAVAQPRRVGRGLALMASSMVVHGLWDSMGALAHGAAVIPVLMIVISILSFAALFVALRLAGGREREWLRDVLAPEVTNGTLNEAELTALTGHRKDTKAAVRERADGTSRRREKHVLRAARDLAHDLAVADGQDSPEVLHSRAEVHRLRGRDGHAPEPAVS